MPVNDPAASSGVSSSLLGRLSALDSACPVLDTGETSRVFWIPAFAGMTNSPQAAGNTTRRDSRILDFGAGLGHMCQRIGRHFQNLNKDPREHLVARKPDIKQVG